MRKLMLGMMFAVPVAFSSAAHALPALPDSDHVPLIRETLIPQDLIEAKGGRGHGFKVGHGHRAFGWSRGRKVGWRGRGCPPGLWKQGRC